MSGGSSLKAEATRQAECSPVTAHLAAAQGSLTPSCCDVPVPVPVPAPTARHCDGTLLHPFQRRKSVPGHASVRLLSNDTSTAQNRKVMEINQQPLIPRTSALLERTPDSFPAPHGTRRFITAFTTALHYPEPDQSSPHPCLPWH
jgi:hypothetical protein